MIVSSREEKSNGFSPYQTRNAFADSELRQSIAQSVYYSTVNTHILSFYASGRRENEPNTDTKSMTATAVQNGDFIDFIKLRTVSGPARRRPLRSSAMTVGATPVPTVYTSCYWISATPGTRVLSTITAVIH